MRKFFILTALSLATLIMSAGTASGQTLKQDALISIHTLSISLEEGVTMDQYLDFLVGEFLPAYKKNFSCDAYLVKGLNREIEGKIGVLVHFNSKKEWNKYFNDDGSSTETGKAAIDEIRPVLDEMKKLGSYRSENVVDWVVQ